MSYYSLIDSVESAGSIVPSREIKVAVFNQTNKKKLIKEDLITKNSQQRATDDKLEMAMTNLTMFYISKTPQ